MRRIIFALMSTITAVVLLFGYRTSTSNPASAATAIGTASTGGTTTGVATTATPAAPTTATSAAASKTTPATTSASKTVTGQTAQTRYGPVQVQLKVTGKTITAVTVLQSPSGNGRDVEINDAALPVLSQETIQAQSAHIDSVSGATYTSTGYATSLQSALDQAGL